MRLLDWIAVMLGRAPRRPAVSEAARELYEAKRGTVRRADILNAIESVKGTHTWRNRRWAVLIGVNLLFSLSFWLDIQVLEGSMTASRFLGFHLADIYSSLLIWLAHGHLFVNLAIGLLTSALFWGLLAGRGFCAWVCPYHLVAEIGEAVHVWLERSGRIRDHTFHRGVRPAFWLLFAGLAATSGYTLFLTVNPIGILSRALVYGPGLALGWVVALIVFEAVYSRRAWCRYVCPIGLTYGVVGAAAPLRITYNLEACTHEGECRGICEVPHVLEMTIKGRAEDVDVDVGPDCTRCGLCVDICPTNSLGFEFKGLSRLL